MDRRPPISDAEQPAKKIARAAADRSAPTIVRAELEAMQTALSEGIDLEDIKFRPVGGGKNAAYVPAEAAVAVANDIFNFDRWACEVKEVKLVHCTKEDGGSKWSVSYQCLMRVTFLDNGRAITWHEDVGYGSSQQPKLDMALEVAYKAAVTDARKRCLRLFGPALGLTVNSEAFQKAATDARRNAVLAASAAAVAQARAARGPVGGGGAGVAGMGEGVGAGAGAGVGAALGTGFGAGMGPGLSAGARAGPTAGSARMQPTKDAIDDDAAVLAALEAAEANMKTERCPPPLGSASPAVPSASTGGAIDRSALEAKRLAALERKKAATSATVSSV